MKVFAHAEAPLPDRQTDSLRILYGFRKVLPKGYERQALLALSHYPELREVYIEFRFVGSGAPFESRPTVLSTLFRNGDKRHYQVLIAREGHGWLRSILIDSLPFDAQVGVLGHELSHTADFVKRNVFQMTRVALGNLSSQYLDRFENDTDQRAIDHGLGCQLLAWSQFVSRKVPPEFLQGPERYMRPATVEKKLADRNQPCY